MNQPTYDVSHQDFAILIGDATQRLRDLPDACAQTCITSPPYWGLRDYGHEGQLGQEPTPEAYVESLVTVFREVRRVLRDDGTLWLNLGDSYAGSWGNQGRKEGRGTQRAINKPMMQNVGAAVHDEACDMGDDCTCGAAVRGVYPDKQTRTGSWVNDHPTLKAKDLIGIPWRVAFALQADGWYLRSDIIWSKPNPMPESVRDRPTKAHEYVFLLSKSDRYFYDHEAVKEPAVSTHGSGNGFKRPERLSMGGRGRDEAWTPADTRSRRTVWTINTKPFKGAHFAVMPEALVEPPVLAGSASGDVVLDPFSGAGTVGVVALRHGRRFVGCELNPDYAEIAERRILDSIGKRSAA